MDLTLNRRAATPLREQLAAQLELKILAGTLAPGERLPSVRDLARDLRLHANTISAAYRQLEAAGHVRLRRGAGVFVRSPDSGSMETAGDLDTMIRLALSTAFRKGYTLTQVRAAVKRWLGAAAPTRVIVTDPSLGMAELMAHELAGVLSVPIEARDLEELERTPEVLEGTLGVALPFHIERLRRMRSSAAVESVTLEIPAAARQLIVRLPVGAIVLVVSHAPTLLPFASKIVSSLRGDEVLVETHLVSDRGWRRLCPAADLVLADGLSMAQVSATGPRRLHEIKVLPQRSLQRIRRALGAALTPRTSR